MPFISSSTTNFYKYIEIIIADYRHLSISKIILIAVLLEKSLKEKDQLKIYDNAENL